MNSVWRSSPRALTAAGSAVVSFERAVKALLTSP